MKKKEEPSVSSPEKRPEKRCVKKDTATSPAFNEIDASITRLRVTTTGKPDGEIIAIKEEGGTIEKPETLADEVIKTGYTIPEPDHPMDNHPAGRCLPKRVITDMYRIGKLGQHKHVPSRMESESVNCHTMTYKNQEIEMENNQRPPD